MKKCKIGVIGVGRGSMMWKYCKDAENAEIVAICDKWVEGLEKAKAQIASDSVTYYTDYDEVSNLIGYMVEGTPILNFCIHRTEVEE